MTRGMVVVLIVFTSVASRDAGEVLARKIVEARLAACVQVLPQMTSVYIWEGKVHSEQEHLMLIKSLSQHFEELREFIIANHSYEVPEIIAVESDKVSGRYLSWMNELLG
jgi:periplasmic divalent cation tolerance protein